MTHTRILRTTTAEQVTWICAGAAALGFLLTLVILLNDRASYAGPPVGTIACMALALTVFIAAAIPAIILTGWRQIANQQAQPVAE